VLLFLSVGFLVLARSAFAETDLQKQKLAIVQEEAKRGNYKLITPESLRDRFLKNASSLFLVDTRQDWEYQQEHIQGAVNLPIKPTWWAQYSPWVRSAMKKVLGTDREQVFVFY
jgi:predicted sulfurtransferase